MRSDWLEAFLTFSEQMNFTRAAEVLNISQPALHVKIRQLGEWLDVPLYRKDGRQLVLTPTGEKLAAFAREQRERSDGFVETLRTGFSRQPVVLCAGEGAYLYLLGPAISQFIRNETHSLRLVTANQDQASGLLLSGKAHLGVSAPDEVPDGVRSQTLTEVDQVLVLPAGHRLAHKRRIALSDLDGEALIVPPKERPHRIMINRMLMDAGVSWRVAVEANGWELMLHFVKLNMGLAIVNGCCRIGHSLVAKPLADLPRIRYQILYRSNGWQHAGARHLRELLLANRDAWKTGKD